MAKKHKKKKGKRTAQQRLDLTDPSVVQHLVKEGQDHFEKGDWRGVIANWQVLVDEKESALNQAVRSQVTERLAKAHFAHGLSFYPEKNIVAVLSEMHQAVRLQPTNNLYKYHLGLAYHRKGSLAKAVEVYQELAVNWQQGQMSEDLGQRVSCQLALAQLELAGQETAAANLDSSPRQLPGLALGTEAYSQNDIQRLQAIQAVKNHQYEEALELLSDQPGSNGQIGLLLAALGKDPEALSVFNDALSSSPNAPFAHYLRFTRGWLLCRQGKYAEGAADFRACQEQGFSHPELKQALGQAYYLLALEKAHGGQLRHAALLWEKAADTWEPLRNEANSNRVRVYLRLGSKAWDSGEIEKAISHWERATQLDPNDPDGWQNLALAMEQQEDWQAANEYWGKVLSALQRYGKRKDDWQQRCFLVYRRRIQNWNRLENPFAIEDDLKAALKLDRNNIPFLLELGDFYVTVEEFALARTYFRRVLKLDPKHVDVRRRLAAIAVEDENWREAARWADEILQFEPRDETALQIWKDATVEIAQEAGRRSPEQAIQILQQILDRDPNDSRAMFASGVLALVIGNRKAAQAWFDRAESIDKSWQTYCRIGLALLMHGFEKDGRRYLKLAETAEDSEPVTFLAIASVYAENGNPRLASRYCQEAVDRMPEDLRAWLAAAVITHRCGNRTASDRFLAEARRLAPGNIVVEKVAEEMRMEDELDPEDAAAFEDFFANLFRQ